jgi:hypothetical protein
MTDSNLSNNADTHLPSAAIAALQQGNKIEAIKIVRDFRDVVD